MQNIERDAKAERALRVEERQLWEQQVAAAKREAAANTIALKVSAGAHHEALTTGRLVPSAAVLAHLEVETKAANLDVPLAPSPNDAALRHDRSLGAL